MQTYIAQRIAEQLSLPEKQVIQTLNLLNEGATVPFISRYRKEMTGGLDEVQIGEIRTQNIKLNELQKRKSTILSTLEELDKLTPELRERIEVCFDSNTLEDIYLPYKPKRKTRAEIARQNGLEPLAKIIFAQNDANLTTQAHRFVRDNVDSIDNALKGARDIIAEWISENELSRNQVRGFFRRQAEISAKVIKGKEEEAVKYRDYFDFSEPLKRCSSHRLLALRRAESEGFLRVSISPSDDEVIDALIRKHVRGTNECSKHVADAAQDAYKRLLKSSIETEFAHESKERADKEAIQVFTTNLKQLLLAAPLGQKRVMGIDPGFRTGCKVVCLDGQGNLLHNETIYPHPPKSEYKIAARKVEKLVEQYKIEAIAIGNGTAGRETESFIVSLRFHTEIQAFVVSEDGASIYSASKIARDEFPDYDVTVRGAVSIGRRLMDPLAELVKIEAKSLGIGQYQHDVDQAQLKQSLDQTVESCVNSVGVNLNTASKHLLSYISGVGPQLAQKIIDYRTEHGSFRTRKELLKVSRMGTKAFEQAAGFLRIPDGDNPLDNSAVHPERYAIVEKMASDLKVPLSELINNKSLKEKITPENYLSETCGLPTLTDILHELEKPGRDPRKGTSSFSFDPNVKNIEDLKVGMELLGIVTNITNFGCFVDVGIHEKGLVHISQLADRFVSDPTQIVALQQHVRVKVIEIDLPRKRIALTLKNIPQP